MTEKKKGRPQFIHNKSGKYHRVLINIDDDMNDALVEYYIVRLKEHKNVSKGLSDAVRELLILGLETWSKQQKGRENA